MSLMNPELLEVALRPLVEKIVEEKIVHIPLIVSQ